MHMKRTKSKLPFEQWIKTQDKPFNLASLPYYRGHTPAWNRCECGTCIYVGSAALELAHGIADIYICGNNFFMRYGSIEHPDYDRRSYRENEISIDQWVTWAIREQLPAVWNGTQDLLSGRVVVIKNAAKWYAAKKVEYEAIKAGKKVKAPSTAVATADKAYRRQAWQAPQEG